MQYFIMEYFIIISASQIMGRRKYLVDRKKSH